MKTYTASTRLSASFLTILLAVIAAAFWAMPVTAHGQMYVMSSSGTSAIIGEYNLDGSVLNPALITGSGLTFAISGANLYVLSEVYDSLNQTLDGTVSQYALSGTTATEVNPSVIPGLSSVDGFVPTLAVSGSNIFIISSGESLVGSIGEYSLTSGLTVNASVVTGLNQPQAMIVSGTNLFVTSGGSDGAGTIGEYTLGGDPVNAALVTGLPIPEGLAISGTNLFVTCFSQNAQAGSVDVYAVSGTTAAVVNAPLISRSDEFFLVNGIAVSGTNIYLLNQSQNGVVGEYSTAGGTENAALIPTFAGGQNVPVAIVVPAPVPPVTAQIFISNWGLTANDYIGAIGEYDLLAGGQVSTVSDSVIMDAPAPEVLASSGSNLFVMNQEAGTVDLYAVSSTGVTLVTPSLISGLTLLSSIAVSGTMIYVGSNPSDTTGAATVSSYNTSGLPVNPSVVTGLANSPGGIAVSGTTLFVSYYVSEGSPGIVGEYSTSGAVLNPSLIPDLGEPAEMVVSGNKLFIVDFSTDSICKYSVSGTTATPVSVPLVSSIFPGGLALSGTDLFVTDQDSGSAYEITTDGAMVNPSLVTGFNLGPTGIAVIAVQTSSSTPPTVEFSITGPTTDGAIIDFGATTTTGLKVRVQSSLDGTTWTDLPDNNGAAMTEDPNTPGNYSLNSTFYPVGNSVSFRAVATDSSSVDYPSPANGTYVLTRAALSIGVTLASTSDPVHGTVSHIGDDLTYNFTVINSGSATARGLKVVTPFPTYIQNQTNIETQFSSADIPLDGSKNPMISSGFSYITTSGTNQIVWDAGDLDAGDQLSKSFTLHITSAVRLLQSLSIQDNYIAYSPTFQPPYSATGASSGSPNYSSDIQGPIIFSMVPQSTSVAPGGLITYSCTLTNLSSTYVKNAIAVIVVPDGLSYSDSYPTPTARKKSLPGVAWASSGLEPSPAPIEDFWTGSNPEIVIDVSALYPVNDPKHRNSVVLNVTFRAQWANPETISTIDYGAAFFDPSTLYISKGKSVTEYDLFDAAFKIAGGTSAANSGTTDFLPYLGSTSNDIAASDKGSGLVTVALQGTLAGEPILSLTKAISNEAVDTEYDGNGVVNVVQPGGKLTFILAATNAGDTEADDVYVRDALPDHVSSLSAKWVEKPSQETQSEKASKLVATLDPVGIDGHHHHVRFDGLKLKPADFVSIEYTVTVDSGASAPANGTLINSDASTVGCPIIPQTPEGLYNSGPIEITGSARFAQPVIQTLVANPVVSTDVNATAGGMTSFYSRAKTKGDRYPESDVQLTSATELASYIPGEERYYIEYENTGTVPASGVTSLSFPIPAHTAFYRASFASAPSRAGFLPDHLIATAPSDSITPPAGANGGFLSTGGTATFNINKLPPNSKGYAMVEVIVTSDAVQQAGSQIGVTDGPIVIQDAPQGTTAGIKNQALMPIVDVATASSAESQLLTQTATGLRPSTSTPSVAQVGIMRIAPLVVTSGSTFDITWLIFNYANTPSPALNFEFSQPAGVTFVQANITTLYSGNFVIDTVGQVPATGADEEVFWQPIPANSAVAVTYTYTASGGAGNPIVDAGSKVVVDYLGAVQTDPASITVVTPGTPLPGGANTQISPAGRPLHYFSANSSDVYIIDIGGGNVVVQGAASVVAQGGGTIVTQLDNNIAVYGPSTSIPIGSTTASFLVANVSNGAALAAVGVTPGIVAVPRSATYIAPSNALIVAAGAGLLLGQHGAAIVASGAGNIVASGAGNLIAQDGAGIVASGAGNAVDPKGVAAIVASDAGNIVSTNGSNLVASGAGNVLPSVQGTGFAFSTGGGSIVASGAGNFVLKNSGN